MQIDTNPQLLFVFYFFDEKNKWHYNLPFWAERNDKEGRHTEAKPNYRWSFSEEILQSTAISGLPQNNLQNTRYSPKKLTGLSNSSM